MPGNRLHRPAVALLIETSNAYARGLLLGIVSYVRAHQPWSIYLPEQGRGDPSADWLLRWRGDGLIARIETKHIARIVAQTGLPVVDVSAGRYLPHVPCVETDNRAIAQLAIEHFLERGFRNLAFCGEPVFAWSNERQHYFQEIAMQKGLRCFVFAPSSGRGRKKVLLARQQQELTEWVRSLPKPAGVFACYDIKAQQLLEVCRMLGLAVPEELAVLGVDNDELLCNLATPPLSSVILNTHRTGYEAAALLDRLLAGHKVPPKVFPIAPLGIQTRQSTDILAIDNCEVAAAVRFIREHACTGINVEDVLAAAPLSRRVLESLFRKYLGRTPHEEIVRLKVERVKLLLAETNLSMAEIARHSGFHSVEYLSAAFKKTVGVSPRQYRRQSQGLEGK
jgi:LacI family transcriptional regulator